MDVVREPQQPGMAEAGYQPSLVNQPSPVACGRSFANAVAEAATLHAEDLGINCLSIHSPNAAAWVRRWARLYVRVLQREAYVAANWPQHLLRPAGEGGPVVPAVKVSLVVRNWLSPNYCRDGVKNAIELGLPYDAQTYFKRDHDKPCDEAQLISEAEEVVRHMLAVSGPDDVTVFHQQEAWPQLLTVLSEHGLIVPTTFHTKYGSSLVTVVAGENVRDFVSVESVRHFDFSEAINTRYGIRLCAGTNNPAVAKVRIFGLEHVFVSCHWPHAKDPERRVDVPYGEGIRTLLPFEADRIFWTVGADLSGYQQSGLDLTGLTRGLDGVRHSKYAESPDGKELWESTLMCQRSPIDEAKQYADYARSDHSEHVRAAVVVFPRWVKWLSEPPEPRCEPANRVE